MKVAATCFHGGLLVLVSSSLGAEFQVNSFTTDPQRKSGIAHDSAGGFTVVWNSWGQDGSGYGIFGQRFGGDGTRLGGEFQINSFTTSSQGEPAVSHASAGGFVVVWGSMNQDGSALGVFGQRFDHSGGSLGAEFKVNSFTISDQWKVAVSHDSAGGFVVVWTSSGQDGSGYGVFGQRFASDGTPLGGEFQINSFTINNQRVPAVSHDSAGGFVVVWQSMNQDGSYDGIFSQRYDSAGNVLGAEFQVNSYTPDHQYDPAVSHDSAGGFVIVWGSYGQDGSAAGVFGRRLDSAGNPLGSEFQINGFTTNGQYYPAISHDPTGGFVVMWTSYTQDGGFDGGVFGQRFSSGGIALGGEFQANSFTVNSQDTEAVSHDPAGGFVVVWDSGDQDGSGAGIFGQRFVAGRMATGPSAGGASRVRRLEGQLLMAPP